MHVSEWIENGYPENTWFTIIRQEKLSSVNENTPFRLASLIRLCLHNYGDFEMRQCQPIFFDSYWTFEDKFIVVKTMGIVNSKEVPVVALIVEARVIKSRIN